MKRLIVPLAILLAVASIAGAQTADMVYTNGKIYTVDDKQPWAEAVAIKDGKFIKVGSADDVKNVIGKDTTVVDLEGQFVLPGLHDVHCHPYEAGIAYIKCKLPGTLDAPTWDDFLAAIEEGKKNQPGNGWFYGEGYTAGVIPEGKYNKATLDELFPDRPAFLQDESGHNGWVNSKAIELAKVTPETKVPPGNELVVDSKTGELNGQVVEIAAMQIFKDIFPTDSEERKMNGLRLAMKMANENGLTSWYEAWTLEDAVPIWNALAKNEELTLHTRLAPLAIGFDGVNMNGPAINELMEKYELPGLTFGAKIFVDGTAEGGTAGFLEPAGRDKNLGSLTVPKENLFSVVASLDASGIQVKTHAVGDRGVRTIVDAYQAVIEKRGGNLLRHHVAHAAHVHPDDYPRFKALDIAIESNIAQSAPMMYMRDVIKPVTPDRMWEENTFAFRKMLDNGAVLAGASDWSSLPFNPFYAMGGAVTRTDPKQPDLGVWSPKNRITVEEAIKVYTISGAYVMNQEKETGSIEAGKSADMVVINQNLLEIDPMKIFDTKVVTTVFAGKIVYDSIGTAGDDRQTLTN